MALSSLAPNEQNGLVLEDGDLGLDAVFPSSLIGKVLATKTLNKNVVSSIIIGAWKVRGTLNISHWSDNVYHFQFSEEDDRNRILCDGPWSLMGSLLVLRPLTEGQTAAEVDFQWCPFWMQAHGLSFNNMTKRTGEVNTLNPLPRGLWLQRPREGKEIWISFKYEKLSDFCYDYGRLGHDNKVCKFVTREQGQSSGYGPALRIGVARSLGLIFDNHRNPGMKGCTENDTLLNHRGTPPDLAPDTMAAHVPGTRP
ncbi:hypothetical protein ACSBR2_042931 [Camellia fascicularis]